MEEIEQLKRKFNDFQLTVEEILFGMDARLNSMSKEISSLNNVSEQLVASLDETSSDIKSVRTAMDKGFELAFRKILEK